MIVMDYGQIVYNEARAGGMPPALSNLIVAQARHETGDFTSSVFRTCQNAFGYKAVFDAPKCLMSPEGNNYENYSGSGGLAASTRELVAWIRRRQTDGKFPADLSRITTAEDYASLLKNAGYFGDSLSTYANGLKRFWREYGAAVSISGGVLILGLIFLLTRKRG